MDSDNEIKSMRTGQLLELLAEYVRTDRSGDEDTGKIITDLKTARRVYKEARLAAMKLIAILEPDPEEDSITELVNALENWRMPSLSWIKQWSTGGQDPVHLAWSRSKFPNKMMRFIMYTRNISTKYCFLPNQYCGKSSRCRLWSNRGLDGRSDQACTECCNRIRRFFRKTPTFQELCRRKKWSLAEAVAQSADRAATETT